MPNGTRTDSINHRIDDTGSPVKKIFKNQTETQQFKRWFGDWIKNPSKASEVVDKEGKPLIVYHGSPELNINIFNKHV